MRKYFRVIVDRETARQIDEVGFKMVLITGYGGLTLLVGLAVYLIIR